MPTNEERREVAARLRNYENLSESLKESPICAFIDALGLGGYHDWKDVCIRIADLIEPEPVCIANVTFTDEQVEKIKADVLKELELPERTCRMKKKESKHVLSGWWECSECGIVYPPCNEEIALWALKYCPHCGAKVVLE